MPNTESQEKVHAQRIFTQPFPVVGCIINHEGKYLLVQESWGTVRGLWNQPAGWINIGEPLAAAALREAVEETGLELELLGLIGVYTLVRKREGVVRHAVKFIFAAKAHTTEPKINPEEVMDARWFSLDEIRQLGDKLRDPDIIKEIEDYEAGKLYPLEAVRNHLDTTPTDKQ